MKTEAKAKSIKKVAMPKYVVTTFVDKKKNKTTRIIEEIVAGKIVYNAIQNWCGLKNKDHKDFPWYKDQTIKMDKYRTVTIKYTDNPEFKPKN